MPTFNDPATQATPYTIEILDGVQAGVTISLEGRALPYRGVAYETEQRIKTTYYPGNPVATQQVMGPVDKNTAINGIWKDVFLGNRVAEGLVETFDGLCRSGVTVRVSWGAATITPAPGDNGAAPVREAVQRIGIIRRFKAVYDRPQDITWEMEFEWRGRDEVAATPLTSTRLVNPRESFGETTSAIEDALDAFESFTELPINALYGFSEAVQETFDTAQNLLARAGIDLAVVVNAPIDGLNLTSDTIGRAQSLAAQGAAQAKTIIDTLDSIPDVARMNRDSALDFLLYLQEKYALFTAMDNMRESAARLDAALALQAAPDVLAEVWAPSNTDLRDLAARYYNDPDLWWVIADFNNLQGSKVPTLPSGPSDAPGLPIRVPRRPSGATGSLRHQC